MLDYNFYKIVFKGNSIAEQDFSEAINRAYDEYKSYERLYTIFGSDCDVKKAICAMAEVKDNAVKALNDGVVASTSIGSTSVTYARPSAEMYSEAQQKKDMYREASKYVQFYRGVR